MLEQSNYIGIQHPIDCANKEYKELFKYYIVKILTLKLTDPLLCNSAMKTISKFAEKMPK